MSAPMVRAILAGTKTQTRRIVKGIPHDKIAALTCDSFGVKDGRSWWTARDRDGRPTAVVPIGKDSVVAEVVCPYGVPTDRLWCRETWAPLTDYRGSDPGVDALARGCFYAADYPNLDELKPELPRWRPSIFMPRSRSRLTLELAEVRVERLQAISEDDAKAEGVTIRDILYPDEPRSAYSYVAQYRLLWESINGPGSWEANPFVWVLAFRRVEPDR